MQSLNPHKISNCCISTVSDCGFRLPQYAQELQQNERSTNHAMSPLIFPLLSRCLIIGFPFARHIFLCKSKITLVLGTYGSANT